MSTKSTSTPNTIPVGTWTADQYNSNTGVFIRRTTATSPTFIYGAAGSSIDQIIDEQPKFQRYGNCAHTRTACQMNGAQFSVTWIHAPDKYIETWSGGYWEYNVIRNLGPGWISVSPVVRPTKWEENSYLAMKAMRPKFSDASFVNDIIELGQVADLINPLGLRKGWLKRLKRGRSRPAEKRDKVPVLEKIRALSNMHLWYQFGIKPAVQSANEVIRLLRVIPDKIREMRAKADKIQKRHWSREMDSVDLPLDALVYNSNGIKVNRSSRWLTAPIYHASLRFKYDLSHLADWELKMRAWVQAFGLDKPLRIAWNAIPFSFVVDWFVDIGEWLGSLTGDDLIPIIVQDFCHSTKFEHLTTAIIEYPFGTGPVKTSVTRHVGNRKQLVYDRRRGVPSTTSRLRFDLPSVAQVFTLGALAVQRSPRKPLRIPNGRKLPWLKFSSGVFVR